MPVRGIIFDLDGTVVDVSYDWPRIKRELNTRGRPILDTLNNLKEPELSQKKLILENYERDATRNAELKAGFHDFMKVIRKNGLRTALVTNNSAANVEFLLKRFNLHFDLVLSRESGLWKPSPAPFYAVMEKFLIAPEECCVIGDSHFDLMAAESAGIDCVFLLSDRSCPLLPQNVRISASYQELSRQISDFF